MSPHFPHCGVQESDKTSHVNRLARAYGLLNSYVLVRVLDYKLCGNQMEFIGRLSGAQRIGRAVMKSGTRPETRRLLEAKATGPW